jgi:hypothetical protein
MDAPISSIWTSLMTTTLSHHMHHGSSNYVSPQGHGYRYWSLLSSYIHDFQRRWIAITYMPMYRQPYTTMILTNVLWANILWSATHTIIDKYQQTS